MSLDSESLLIPAYKNDGYSEFITISLMMICKQQFILYATPSFPQESQFDIKANFKNPIIFSWCKFIKWSKTDTLIGNLCWFTFFFSISSYKETHRCYEYTSKYLTGADSVMVCITDRMTIPCNFNQDRNVLATGWNEVN